MGLSKADLYAQAASVRGQTGVDPAIIATIASTESLLSLSPPFTLGITTVATRGGQGASGGSLRSSSPFAGSSQPAAFWSYQNGAEAAQGFANYIRAYQPNLAPLLGDARAFFDPAGPILGSNYYVPTPGGLPASRYYANWQKVADEIIGAAGESNPIIRVLDGLQHGFGGQAAPGETPGVGTTELVPGATVVPGVGVLGPTESQAVAQAPGLGNPLDAIGSAIHEAVASWLLGAFHLIVALFFGALILLGLYLLLAN